MARIYKHPKSAFWFADYFLPNGNRKRTSTKTTNRADAERVLASLTAFQRTKQNSAALEGTQRASKSAEKRHSKGKTPPREKNEVATATHRAENVRQLAKIAGVSASTVSRALRNERRVARSTCLRIQKLASDAGYRANPMVSALMASRVRARSPSDRQVLAYINPFEERGKWRCSPIFIDYFEGASARAIQYGYKLEEFWLREPRMTAGKMSDILFHRGIQGILLGPLDRRIGHLSLKWERFSVAALGYSMTHPAVHRAVADNLLGIRMILRQLRRLGYRRIGLALDPAHDVRCNKSWSAGFAEYLHFLPSRDRVQIFYRGFYLENLNVVIKPDCVAKFHRWLEKERPDAVIAGSPLVKTWIRQAGFHVPHDIGFALLDRSLQDAAYSGIYQNGRDIGAAAIDLIVGQINRNERGLPEVQKRTVINCRWLEGASTRTLDEHAAERQA